MQYQCYDVVRWTTKGYYQLYDRGSLYAFKSREVLVSSANAFWSDEDLTRVQKLITPKEYS